MRDCGKVTYSLMYLKCITNSQHRTADSAQCCVLARMAGGSAYGRTDACLCVMEAPHCSPGTLTTLLIGCSPAENVFGVKK